MITWLLLFSWDHHKPRLKRIMAIVVAILMLMNTLCLIVSFRIIISASWLSLLLSVFVSFAIIVSEVNAHFVRYVILMIPFATFWGGNSPVVDMSRNEVLNLTHGSDWLQIFIFVHHVSRRLFVAYEERIGTSSGLMPRIKTHIMKSIYFEWRQLFNQLRKTIRKSWIQRKERKRLTQVPTETSSLTYGWRRRKLFEIYWRRSWDRR